MKKKSILTMALALVLVGAIGVGATLAYFTDKADATNIVTMGHVDIELTEPEFETYLEDGISGVVPGQEIAKDPTITLAADSKDAYVRVKLEVTGLEDEYAQDIIDSLDIQEGWTLVDGYYYYSDKLTQENNTATLFETVTIPTDWDNAVADLTFNIKVSAEAIQADYLADDFFNDNKSWNIDAETISEYAKAVENP